MTDTQRTAVDDIFGSADTGSAPVSKQTVPSNPPQSKGAFDELEDDFEGLEDAKEGSADDDFANISRSGLDDFNPVFDSSPPASQTKSESTAFGNESSFDFVSASSTGAPKPPASGAQTAAEAQHDWDAIFSGFDSGSTPPVPSASADKQATASGPAQSQEDEVLKDDPILKRLTSMGYERDSALDALEKYDYDVNKVRPPFTAVAPIPVKANRCPSTQAANHLASHS